MKRLSSFVKWLVHHRLVVASSILLLLLFALYFYAGSTTESVSGLEVVGADLKVLYRTQQELCMLKPIYPQGEWAAYNSVAPRQNYRYSVILMAPFRCTSAADWPIVQEAILASLFFAHIFGIWLLFKAFQANGVRMRMFVPLIPLLILNGPLIGTEGYGNLEGILLLLSTATLLSMSKSSSIRWSILIGFAIFAFAITKYQWLALVGGAAIPAWIIARRDKDDFFYPIGFGACLAVLFYVIGLKMAMGFLGDNYAMKQVIDQFRFSRDTLSHIPFHLPWLQPGVSTDNAVLPTFMNIFGVWGMTTMVGPFAVTTWLTLTTYIAGVLFFAYHVVLLLKHREKAARQLIIAFAYLALFVAMLFLPQLEYATPVAFTYVFLTLEDSSDQRKPSRRFGFLGFFPPLQRLAESLSWRHVLLPYTLYILPWFIYMGTGIRFFDWDNSYLIIFSVAASILLLGRYIRRSLRGEYNVAVEPMVKDSDQEQLFSLHESQSLYVG